jgi:hypothetical protein
MLESRLRALVPSVQFISRLSIATLLLITPLMKLRLVTAFSPASLSTSWIASEFTFLSRWVTFICERRRSILASKHRLRPHTSIIRKNARIRKFPMDVV